MSDVCVAGKVVGRITGKAIGKVQPQLDTYFAKRDPNQTPEPFGRLQIPATGKLFVVQQHAASHLHFDLRLEVDGVLKSWAVPKGPSDDPADKRLAMETEDHPLDYADFEGEIPPGNYGAGHVIVWDRGRFRPKGAFAQSFAAGYDKGKLLFELQGHKLQGRWTLVRIKSKEATGKQWLLIKELDAYVSDGGPTYSHGSVLSGLTLKQLKHPSQKLGPIRRAIRQAKGGQTTNPKTNTALSKSSVSSTRPMLAQAGEASDRPGWIWELKYDGYRILAHKHFGEVALITRNGHTISHRFPEICQVLTHLPVDNFVLDGELVVNDHLGRPSFALMQQRARSTSAYQVASAAIEQPATYYCFDLLAADGVNLCACELTTRKKILQKVLPQNSAFIYSQHIINKGRSTYQTALQLGIEGVVGKRANSQYRSGRSPDWVKVRNQRRDEFVVVGWSPAKGNADDIGSLALAEYRGDDLCYAGHAGSGLGAKLRDELVKRVHRLARKTSPLTKLPDGNKTIHWLRPQIVIEIAFTQYTPYGHLRHPSIQRLRDDKSPRECVGHFVAEPEPESATLTIQPQRLVITTNPDKIYFPEPDFRKQDLVNYYRSIAPWMLPFLADRPIVLTRYPDGVGGKSFYQRDVPDYVPDWIRREVLWSDSTDKPVNYFIVHQAEDLAYIANMGTLPIHMWHARTSNLTQADWCVLDLDPKSAPFADVITLALGIKILADELQMPAYVKTSGASGLHVLIPLGQQLNHDQSRTLGELLARVIVDRFPDIATIARSIRSRNKKVYVDFMQNGHGRLIAAPYCVRAEPSGSVSMPLAWHEVNSGLRNDKYHIGNALRRVRRFDQDPFAGVLQTDFDLARSLALLQDIS